MLNPASVIAVPPRFNVCSCVKPFEMPQPGVRHLGAAEVQRPELRQARQMLQPGVCYRGPAKVQRLE